MILDLCSLAFNLNTETPGGNPSWGTSVGQGADYKFDLQGRNLLPLFASMVYTAIEDASRVTGPFGKGGNKRDNFSVDVASHYKKIYVNGKKVVGAEFLLLLVREVVSQHHAGRRTLKYHEKYCLDDRNINMDCYTKMAQTLGISPDAAWFINEIHAENQDELHFEAHIVDENEAASYKDNDTRKEALQNKLEEDYRINLGAAQISDQKSKTLKDQFRFFLSNCLRTNRRDGSNFNYGESAVTSYLSYMEAKNLLGPIALEWVSFKSAYDIKYSNEVKTFFEELLNNEDFVSWDKSRGQWPANTLMNYYCFLRAKEYFSEAGVPLMKIKTDGNLGPLQQIFFGAPGTAKSTRIKRDVADKEQHRVTFHPDTDYSSFVGCYKPTTNETIAPTSVYSKSELATLLKQIKDSGVSYPYHKFAYKYWNSVKVLSTADKKEILTLCGASENYTVEFDKAVALGEEYSKANENSITYKFVAQPFINAYVSAWKKLYDGEENQKEVFLIVEEINRGNCAQIFGDLFQLLDRNEDGYSDYSIEPDTDLQRYLKDAFAETDIPARIKEGREMLLPPNLYIWATMNTSDQSLFPIDSAFKRRWDWKYTPIKNEKKNHMIRLKDRQFDWWEFLEAVNKRIEKLTESEDKQLGYWFAKPETGTAISADKFVSKVVFYLWNDVFKDYGQDINSPFVIKQDDGKKINLRFKSFFDEDGNVDENVLIQFFWGLKLETKSLPKPSDSEVKDDAPEADHTENTSESATVHTKEEYSKPGDASNVVSEPDHVIDDDDDDDEDDSKVAASISDLFQS